MAGPRRLPPRWSSCAGSMRRPEVRSGSLGLEVLCGCTQHHQGVALRPCDRKDLNAIRWIRLLGGNLLSRERYPIRSFPANISANTPTVACAARPRWLIRFLTSGSSCAIVAPCSRK